MRLQILRKFDADSLDMNGVVTTANSDGHELILDRRSSHLSLLSDH